MIRIGTRVLLLQRMILGALLPAFASAVLFLVLIIELADLFPNLFRYLDHGVSFAVIARIALLYLPKAVVFAVPIALLFAVAYGLGSFYAQGELSAMFGAGASLRRLVQPLVALAALLSGALFLFEDEVAIHALRMKNQLYRTALDIRIRLDDANLALASPDRRVITHADFYDDDLVELTRVLVLERAADGTVTTRLDAERAQWDGGQWVFDGVRRFIWDEAGGIREERYDRYPDPGLLQGPEVFRREQRDVNEMRYRHALAWVAAVRSAGGEYRAALAKTYGKISFALTPLLVTLIAAALGGLLRRNVALVSLLLALGLAVVFFVLRMLGETLARVGLVSPEVGAFAGVGLFLAVGVALLRAART